MTAAGRPIRVMQLLTPLTIAGAERVVLNALKRLDPARFRQSVAVFRNLAHGPNPFVEFLSGLNGRLEEIPLDNHAEWQRLRRLTEILRRHQVQILHTHSYRADVLGWLAGRRVGCKLVSTVHGWTSSSGKLRFYEKLDRLALRRFDRVIAVSEDIAGKLRAAGVAAGRISVLRNSIDTEAYPAGGGEAFRAVLGWGSPLKLVGTAGRLSPEKGIDILLRAASQLVGRWPEARFLIAGDGPQRTELEALAAALGLGERVHFCGYLADVGPFYDALDVFVLPSRTEGMPISLLEAFLYAKPCVATSVGGVAELVDRPELGCLVPPGDAAAVAQAIDQLLAARSLAQEMGRQARLRVEHDFSPQSWAGGLAAIYGQLTGP